MNRKLSLVKFSQLVSFIHANWNNSAYREYIHPKTGYSWTISNESVIVWNLQGDYIAILLKGE